MASKQPPIAPVEHANEREHRRLIAYRANAALTPVISTLTAGQRIMWDGGAWVNDGEEGTWTPTYTTSGTDFDSVTYDIQVGRYRKTGTLVYVEMRLRTDAITKGSASGSIEIHGLPFPVLTSASTGSVSVAHVGFASAFLADMPSSAFFGQGTSQIGVLKRATSVSATASLVVADMNTGVSDNDILLSGWYLTS